LIQTHLNFHLEQTGEQLAEQQQDHSGVKYEETRLFPTDFESRQVCRDQIHHKQEPTK
jgi:hypothetical protein